MGKNKRETKRALLITTNQKKQDKTGVQSHNYYKPTL
jgi:hypothetical protein